MFNDYKTNPLSMENDPEKQLFLQRNHIHTSMSEGDVVFLEETGWYYNHLGWKRLG